MGFLAFLVTGLFLFTATITLAYALLTRRRTLAGRVGRWMLIWLGLYFTSLVLVSLTTPQPIIGQGDEHCFDEMCFSVQTVKTASTLGTAPQPVAAQGTYYVVTVQLRNAGRGRAQRPDHPAMRIVDQQGRSYGTALDAEETPGHRAGQPLAIAQLWDQPIQPGESVTHSVAFDLPGDVTQPRLIITEGTGPTPLIIGDENSLFHSQTAISLIPSPTSPAR